MIDDHEKKLAQDPGNTQFICSVNDDKFTDIISYNKIINHIANQEDEAIVWKFKLIVTHEWQLNESNTNYKGSRYNVMVGWETG